MEEETEKDPLVTLFLAIFLAGVASTVFIVGPISLQF